MINIGQILLTFPRDLTENLIKEFQNLHEQYYLGKWQFSQLNGGRFGEIVLRIIQFKDTGTYTPIGTTLPRRSSITNHAEQNSSLPVSLRLYIANATCLVMDFRNNRNVAHPGIINVNFMDATFVIQTANWIMAEIIQLESGANKSIQKIIDKIIEKKVPIIEEIGGRLKILNPDLTTKHKILLCLYQKYPNTVSDKDLLKWIPDKNPTRFRKYITNLDQSSLVDYPDGMVTLTKRGVLWVEKNTQFEIEL